MNRKKFIQSVLGSTALFATPFSSLTLDNDSLLHAIESTSRPVIGNLFGFHVDPIKKVRIGIIGLGNRGNTLIEMFTWLVQNDYAEIVALCDLTENKTNRGKERLTTFQESVPRLYHGSKEEWKNLAKQEDIDLIIIATPWRWHTPMAIYGMEHGKHVASEVPIAYTLSDCWNIVETAERMKRHCIMLENCCYNEEELFVLNMIEHGVFGDLTHAEGAYLHDLRAHMLSTEYYQGQWRLKHHVDRDGNFYTTHGLGPIGFYLHIGRGDNFSHLSSMSSRELNLSETAKREGAAHIEFKCGDMNSTMIKTEKGKTILMQFDVHSGRPYSRINKVVGTKAVHDGYPSRLFIDTDEPVFSGHDWLDENAYKEYKERFTHPMIKKLKEVAKGFKQGHGGMDFIMIFRLIRCLNLGLPLDMNVYDGVMWSAITPLSEISVASKSMTVPVPDFTGAQWKKERPLELMRNVG